jgi:hypothetical protein
VAYGVSSFHGMADSSLRQGQIGRDKTVSVTKPDFLFCIFDLLFLILPPFVRRQEND